MNKELPIIKPGPFDFPEDFKSPIVEHGIYQNTCRECKGTIHGHKYRRTCRRCVEIFQKQAANR